MGFELINIFLGISFLTNAILATLLFIKSHNASGRFLSFVGYGAVFWIFVSFLFYNLPDTNKDVIIFVAKMQYVTSAFILINFLFFTFTFSFLDHVSSKSRKFIAGVSFLFLVFNIFILVSNNFIKSINIVGASREMTFDYFYYIYLVSLFLFIFWGYYYLYIRYKIIENKLAKLQLIYTGIGAGLGILMALFADIILPAFGYFEFLWIGPVSATFFVIFVSYAILRHNLFDIKIITTEILIFLILTAIFVQIFLADGAKEILSRTLLFIFVAVLSIFVLRSVYKETEQREEIERLAGHLSSFVSFVTHELRSPVTSFKGGLSLLLEGSFGGVSSKVAGQLRRLFDISIEMGQNIETFLNLNKLEIGKLELNKQIFDFQDFVSIRVRDFKIQAEKKNISLNFEKSAGDFNVLADKFLISHAINNILSNSIKYTPSDGRVRVFVQKDAEGANFVFNVEDTGIGISPEILPRLFNEYERGGKNVKSFFEGSGVGLFLSKKLVELHGGRIWAESDGVGRGSKFCFSLPA